MVELATMTCSNCAAHPATTPVTARREDQVDLCEFRTFEFAETWCDECVVDYATECEVES